MVLSVMIIITGNGIGDLSSNPGWDHASLCVNALGKSMNPSVLSAAIDK